LSVDFSIIGAQQADHRSLFDVSYEADYDKDRLRISPKVPYLHLLKVGGPILPYKYHWTPFKMVLPEIDVKIVNNSPETVFFTEAVFLIYNSYLDPTPILLIPGESYNMDFQLVNVGWGELRDAQLRFNLIPDTPDIEQMNGNQFIATEFSKAFKNTLSIKEDRGNIDVDLRPIFELMGVDVKTVDHGPIKVESNGTTSTYTFVDEKGLVSKLSRDQYRERLQAAYGPFVRGRAILAGEISYAGPPHTGQEQVLKVIAKINLSSPYPEAPVPPTFQYSVKFDVDGKNYKKSIPLSQALKPKEFDRTIKIAADKSSWHLFQLKLLYNNGKMVESPPMSLNLFMPRDATEFLKEELARDSSHR
jgi:hypothetical protein